MRFLAAASVALLAALSATLVTADVLGQLPMPTDAVLRGLLCPDAPDECFGARRAGDMPPAELRDRVVRRLQEIAVDAFVYGKHGDVLAALPASVQRWADAAVAKARAKSAARGGLFTRVSMPSVDDALAAMREAAADVLPAKALQYPYFGFLPFDEGHAVVGGPAVSFSTPCFDAVSLALHNWSDASQTAVNYTLTTSTPRELLCDDVLVLFGGASGLSVKVLDREKVRTGTWKVAASLSASERWYFQQHGVRVLRTPSDIASTIHQVLETLTMIGGMNENPIKPPALAANLAFTRNYTQYAAKMGPKLQARADNVSVAYDIEDSIRSGDPLVNFRLNGVGPVISYGQGFIASHSVMAMRDEVDNSLHICESTVKDAQWPTNGIQCTPYRTWVKQSDHIPANVLHVPLSPAARAAFNVTKAWQFFRQWEGANYGFSTLLWGWIDTETDNFVCMPPDFKVCLNAGSFELVGLMLDAAQGNATTNLIRQAMSFRANTTAPDGSTPDLYGILQAAKTNAGMGLQQLMTVVERDAWRYQTRYNNGSVLPAPSMVCDVFVCHMWKAGGIFAGINDDIECGEQTNGDIYSMQLFDNAKMGDGRPAACVASSPENPLCLIMGEYTYHAVPAVNTRPLYAQMGDHCPTLTPDYDRTPGC